LQRGVPKVVAGHLCSFVSRVARRREGAPTKEMRVGTSIRRLRVLWIVLFSFASSACGAQDEGNNDSSLCTIDCAGAAAGGSGGSGAGGASGAAGISPGGSGGTSGVSGGASGVSGGASGNAGVGGASGSAGTSAGEGGGGTGGVLPGGSGGMMAGEGGTAGTPAMGEGCTPAPSGSFDTMIVTGTGPGGNYTIVQPTTLGEGGFKHPPVAWGNGLATSPTEYYALLENVASNGFVVIANPGTGSDPQVVRQGLEWLIEQNGSGEYAGKLAADCAGTIGYSMGGGAAVGSGSHPAVKAIVSIHGLQDASDRASGPILLTTSDDDGFVTKSMFVQPCYDRSSVQPTILATHITGNAASFGGHIEPLGTGGEDAAPTIAWLRYWIYGDQAQREWFFGEGCKVCTAPWGDVQKKNHDWD
jgi:hypothetical protein